jgi:hypothetical protein
LLPVNSQRVFLMGVIVAIIATTTPSQYQAGFFDGVSSLTPPAVNLKSQGQSLRFVRVNLVEEVFSHEQLYVELYRAICANQVKVLVSDTITGKHGVC